MAVEVVGVGGHQDYLSDYTPLRALGLAGAKINPAGWSALVAVIGIRWADYLCPPAIAT